MRRAEYRGDSAAKTFADHVVEPGEQRVEEISAASIRSLRMMDLK